MPSSIASRRGACLGLAAGLVAFGLALSGCVEQTADLSHSAELPRPPLQKRDGVSIAAATVAIVSVSGAPGDYGKSFTSALEDAARKRDIVLVDAKAAHYLVRGYLSVAALQDGASIEYVWDVFGPDKQRMFRLNDVIDVQGTADDPWSLVTDPALASVAAKSADDLAAFLSSTPEATPSAAAQAAGPALSYATVE